MSCYSVLQWLWQLSVLEQKHSVPSRTMLTTGNFLTSKDETHTDGGAHSDVCNCAWKTGTTSNVSARVTGRDSVRLARLLYRLRLLVQPALALPLLLPTKATTCHDLPTLGKASLPQTWTHPQ
eukprot:2356748-Amphidinium_carterae.1